MNRSSTRRKCLQLLLGVAASCWSPAGGIEPAAAGEPDRLRRILVALFWETLGVPTIAEAYLRTVPGGQAPPLALMRAIFGQTSLSSVPGMTAAAIRRMVVEHIQVDFLYRRTVSIDGWILSMTEARLYALVRADRPLGEHEPARSSGP